MSIGDKLHAKHTFSADTIARNPALFGRSIATTGLSPLGLPEGKRIKQDRKPMINELEKEYLQVLVGLGVDHLRAQAVRFRIGNGHWYKPDFVGIHLSRRYAWEVKGPHSFRGGMENLKAAASLYPEITWVLAWKDEDTHAWVTQHVLP